MVNRFRINHGAIHRDWPPGEMDMVTAADFDALAAETTAYVDKLVAEKRELEAALQSIAVGLLPEDRAAGDAKMYMLCASRLCGIARDAIRLPMETKVECIHEWSAIRAGWHECLKLGCKARMNPTTCEIWGDNG